MGKQNSSNLSSVSERVSYGFYFVGQNIFYLLVSMFLITFFTDVGIPAITVAALALVVKIWDAVNDPLFGGIVDKVKFKKGKFLPWLRISLIFIPLTTILIFAIPPGLSLVLKIVWAAAAYILWDTAYTICDVPVFGLVTTMTDRLPERTTLMSIGRICAGFGSLLVIVIVPTVRTAIGGWLPTVIVLSIVGLITMIPLCFKARERVESRQQEADVSIKDMLSFLFKNKYMLIYYGYFLIIGALGISGVLNMYFARYNLGNEGLLSIVALITAIPGLLLGFFVPAICKRIDKFTLFFWSSVATLVLSVAAYFVGYHSLTAVLVMIFIKGIPGGFTAVMMFMFTPDCVEYGMYKTGISASGMAFSFQTFSAKVTAAISTAVGAAALSFIGFIEGEGAIQLAGFEDKLFFIYTLIPALGVLIGLPLLWRYKLRDKDVQVMAQYNAGKISREDAETALGGR
jgi:sugar (glycoside-pentoside-hexuronide) transporter